MRTTALQGHHGVRWSPETRVGAWTVALAGFAFVGFVALIVAAGFDAGMDGWADWARASVSTLILGSGAASAVTGVLALRRHERAWSVVCAMAFGVLMLIILLQQVAEGLGWLGS